MLFNSFNFLVFFPVVVLLYYLLPQRYRNFLLLAASIYYFMDFIPAYAMILLAAVAISYGTGLLIAGSQGGLRTVWFTIGTAMLCGILLVFKYYGFIGQNLAHLSRAIGWNYGLPSLRLALPIGISFFTFKAISYLVEVRRGNLPPERNVVVHALYIAFYPGLLAGPIDRPQHLLPQFHEEHRFYYGQVADGLKLMAWGMFKKIVVADRLAEYVNLVYAEPGKYHGWPAILASYFFAFQIYCDFSGYTDIARGAARVMGFRLTENFRRPYFAKSISEFWTRWHISLSSWFRDYVYLPINYALLRTLEGKGWRRTDLGAYAIAAMATMALAGLWHGASWNFVVWGILFGAYMVISVLTKRRRRSITNTLGLGKQQALHRTLKVLVTFHLVLLAWVFFRASDLPAAFTMLRSMADVSWQRPGINIIDSFSLLVSLASIAILTTADLIQRRTSASALLQRMPTALRWGLYYSLAMAIILFGKIYSKQQFIYFQF